MMDGIGELELAALRTSMRRARAQGRRWYLRAVLMILIGATALYQGGQLYSVIGVLMLLLALMSWSLARSTRRQAAAMEDKLRLMDAAGTEARRHGGTE